MDIRVVYAFGKWAVVRGLTPLVGPLSGTINDLAEAAEKLRDPDKTDALTAIDIYKSSH